MKHYLITYFGHPNFASKEEGGAYMQSYRTWLGGLNPTYGYTETPVTNTQVISSSDTELSGMTGYARANADTIEEVIELVRGCPHLLHGTMEVSEEMQMGM